MKPKADYTHSQIANNPAFADYLPTTKVALLAGVPHSRLLPIVVKTSSVLKEPLIERHGLTVAFNTDVLSTMGYTVSPTVALNVILHFNANVRNNLLNHVQATSPAYYDAMLNTVTAKPKNNLAMHKRITYAKPTAEPTADDFVRHSLLCKYLKLNTSKLYLCLIEAGLLKHMPKDRVFGYKITALGMDYIREYRSKNSNYFVYDKKPIIDILRSIAAVKV